MSVTPANTPPRKGGGEGKMQVSQKKTPLQGRLSRQKKSHLRHPQFSHLHVCWRKWRRPGCFKDRNWEFPDSRRTRFPFQWHVGHHDTTTTANNVSITRYQLGRPFQTHTDGTVLAATRTEPRKLARDDPKPIAIWGQGLQGISSGARLSPPPARSRFSHSDSPIVPPR